MYNYVYIGPAVLTVEIPNQKTIQINSLKGQNMRDVLIGAGVEVYGDRAKLVNCSGSKLDSQLELQPSIQLNLFPHFFVHLYH
jgi:enoyl reductase-like protein